MSEIISENNENVKNNNNKSITKKIILIMIMLVLFIINILDFLNKLNGDLDFIEKLISWTLFGYIFYEVSFTKIFIGTRIKKYDLSYIFAFSLIGVVKSIVYYTEDLFYNSNNYFIFKLFLDYIHSLNENIVTLYSFFIGLILIIIISIVLLRKHEIEEDSLLGSIKFNEYAKFLKLDYIVLILISIFFAMILFNYFMEWFALAIDDQIPIIGLFYYLFKYIHDHTNNVFSKFLQTVNSSGEDFFQNLLKSFSNKKTIFIGISFILTLHLLVDCGVYIVSYTTGVQNSLYFSSLDTQTRQHIPLFNFFNIEESRIYYDLTQNFLVNFGIMIIYIITLTTFFTSFYAILYLL